MNQRLNNVSVNEGDEPDLAELTEQITRRLQAGEMVDIDDYTRRYPVLAESIRELLPAMRDLSRLGRLLVGEAASTRLLRKKIEGKSSSFPDANPEVEDFAP